MKPIQNQVCPLKENLERFLNSAGIIDKILDYKQFLQQTKQIYNMTQTSFWNDKYVDTEQDIFLPLVDYFDDFQPLNSIGKHVSAYSVGAQYVTIGVLPPEMSSKNRVIFTSFLFFSHDRKSFGNQVFYKPHIDLLNQLQLEGIKITNHPRVKRVLLVPHVFTSDNKASRETFGNQEHFNADYVCMICTAPYCEICKLCEEKENLLRTVESNLENLMQKTKGVVKESAYKDLINFRNPDTVTQDILHDWLEGICHHDVAKVLNELIYTQKLFSLNQFNNRLRSFNYGAFVNNHPDVVSKTNLNDCKIPFTSAEMLIFARAFTFIYGDLVPENNPNWKLLLTMKKCLRIIMADFYSPGEEIQLAGLIKEHHMCFIELIGECMKPKFHFATHYPLLMKRFGPLRHIWTMRFESHHAGNI